MKTHLIAVSERFVIGSPMLFRVELANYGATPVHYQHSGVNQHPLTVLNETGQALPSHGGFGQVLMQSGELAAGASAVLADKVDISRSHNIAMPGKYTVQFSAEALAIGEPLPLQEEGRFGENEVLSHSLFVPVLTRFPSEIIEIEFTEARSR
jgi:hypothetical protein